MADIWKFFKRGSVDEHLGDSSQVIIPKMSPLYPGMPSDLTPDERKHYHTINKQVVSYEMSQEDKNNLGMEAYLLR